MDATRNESSAARRATHRLGASGSDASRASSASRRSSSSAAASSAAAVHRHASRADGTRHAPPRGSRAAFAAAATAGSVASSFAVGDDRSTEAFFAAACAASADARSASSRSRLLANLLSFTSSGSSNAPGSADQLTSLSPPSLSSALGSAAGGGPPRSKSDSARRRADASSLHSGRRPSNRSASPRDSGRSRGSFGASSPSAATVGIATGLDGANTGSCSYPSRRRRLSPSPPPSRPSLPRSPSRPSRSTSPRWSSLALEGAFRFPRVCFAASVSGLGLDSSRSTASSPPVASRVISGPNLPWRIMRATRSSTGSVYLVLNGAETPGARVDPARAADASSRLGGGGGMPVAPAAPRDRAPCASARRRATMSPSVIHPLSPARFTIRSRLMNLAISHWSMLSHG